MKRGASINQLLRPLDSGVVSQCFLSDFVQVADVLEWILSQLGPSEVWQSSFSVSDEFLRRLFFIRKKHRITKFTMILDHKATNKTIKLWPFVQQVADSVLLADNHSKVMIVIPDSQLPRPPSGSYNFSEPYKGQSFRIFACHYRPQCFQCHLRGCEGHGT